MAGSEIQPRASCTIQSAGSRHACLVGIEREQLLQPVQSFAPENRLVGCGLGPMAAMSRSVLGDAPMRAGVRCRSSVHLSHDDVHAGVDGDHVGQQRTLAHGGEAGQVDERGGRMRQRTGLPVPSETM